MINSDDSTLDRRLIESIINEERALMIRRELNKNRSIDDNLIQDLGCVEMDLSPPASQDCCDVPPGCKILRSVKQIPNAIELYQDKMITRVAPKDLTLPAFHLLELDAVPYFGNGRFNKNQIGVFVRNNYIFLISKREIDKLIDTITVQGVWEDPREAARFTTCDNQPCWTPDSKYPLNTWMWADPIKQRVLEKLRSRLALPRDESNNSQDNTSPQADIRNA
jgi:hypothetical protein